MDESLTSLTGANLKFSVVALVAAMLSQANLKISKKLDLGHAQ